MFDGGKVLPSFVYLFVLFLAIRRGKMRFEASEDFLKIVKLLFFLSKTQQQDKANAQS